MHPGVEGGRWSAGGYLGRSDSHALGNVYAFIRLGMLS